MLFRSPAALTELLDELYGVVSSLKPDLRTIADAVPLLASDEEDERSEGSEMLRDGLNACTDRSNEIRTLVGKIRDLLKRFYRLSAVQGPGRRRGL